MDKRIVTIAIASPSDVQEERDAVVEVIDEINAIFRGLGYPVILEPWRWEIDSRPGMHLFGPQGRIDDLLQFKSKDIVLGIFGERLGTPVHDAVSGTAHEIQEAIKGWKECGAPQVMLYFRQIDRPPADPAQFAALTTLKKQLLREERLLVEDYRTPDEFRKRAMHALITESTRISGGRTATGLVFDVESTPTLFRSDGFTELVGPLIVRCTCPAGAASTSIFSIIMTSNTAFTSRLMSPGLIEAALLEVGRPTQAPIVPGRLIGANQILFNGISIMGMRPGETRIFQITNIRCNANGVGSRGGRPAEIVILVEATSGVVQTGAVLPVASASSGINVSLNDAADERPPAANGFSIPQGAGLGFTRVTTVHLREGFHGAFKTRTNQNPVWSESGTQFSRAADSGTYLGLVFSDIPSGLRLFVPKKYHSGTVCAELVPEYSSIRVPTDELASSHDLAELSPDARLADVQKKGMISRDVSFSTVVWEIRDRCGFLEKVEDVIIEVYAMCARETARTTVSLVAGFYPTPISGRFTQTTAAQASSTLPVPRFSTSHSVSFKIIEVTSDTLSADCHGRG